MNICRIIEKYNIPDTDLDEIIVTDSKQKKLLATFRDLGFRRTSDFNDVTNEDLRKLPNIWYKKIEKLGNFFTEWAENGCPVKEQFSILKPDVVLESLQNEVFVSYMNIKILVLRSNYRTYEEISEFYETSRHNIKDRENGTRRRFREWYKKNLLDEKIGNYDDFVRYCEMNFSDDNSELIDAVKRLAVLEKQLEEKEKKSSL